MDAATQAAVARALDTSIADVAAEEFARLSHGLSNQGIAEEILGALQDLEGLQQNEMPTYDGWDALFYLTWYQPSHIALAYTLARTITPSKNPLRTGKSRLQVVDFGCGALAMQFGLALAGAETLRRRGRGPKIDIVSTDESDHMRRIGKKMWRRFIEEIADADKYPRLGDLRQVCSAMKTRKVHKPTESTRWLTALHVAYEENVDAVKDELDKGVGTWEPNVVLVTTHPIADEWAYSPYDRDAYQGYRKVLSAEDLAPFDGCLEATTTFRRSLHDSYNGTIDRIADSQCEKPISYFLSNQVLWSPSSFESTCFFYLRRRACDGN